MRVQTQVLLHEHVSMMSDIESIETPDPRPNPESCIEDMRR